MGLPLEVEGIQLPEKRLSMRKIKEVLRLRHELGLHQEQIARSCSIGQSVGGGEKGYQFGGREGARCGVALWPAMGAGIGTRRLASLSQAGLSSLLDRGVR